MLTVHARLTPVNAQAPGLTATGASMILTVHDELLIESPREMADEAAETVRVAMQSAVTLAVPLTVDVGIGLNWREAKS